MRNNLYYEIINNICIVLQVKSEKKTGPILSTKFSVGPVFSVCYFANYIDYFSEI